MCLPRRIVVRVAQRLNESWQKELRHFERLSDEIRVSDTVTATLSLDAELGDLAYQGLEQCLAEGFRGWTANGGAWRTEIEGVTATFDPKSRTVTLTAGLSEVVSAAVEQKTTVGDRFVKELHMNLDLGTSDWGANSEIAATERQFRDQLEADLEASKRRKIATARAQLQQQVKTDLEARWSQLSRDKRRELGQLVVERLEAARPAVEREVNLLLSQAYHRALVLLARQQNGRVTRDEETGSVIDLEITL